MALNKEGKKAAEEMLAQAQAKREKDKINERFLVRKAIADPSVQHMLGAQQEKMKLENEFILFLIEILAEK